MSKLTVAVAGLGSRGKDTYLPALVALADRADIVAAADIIPEKVEDVAKRYNIPADKCYDSAEALLACDRLADILVIATQDQDHVAQAVVALRKGYHLLLEKPISPSLEECREIVQVARECNRRVVICHVLRYTPYYTELKRIMDTGVIGDVVTVMAIENVGYWHQAHSFVRGNWRNSGTTSPMILQKCCHDMDLYLWLTGKTCKSISSMGNTYLFKAEKAPEGAALRCMDGCKAKESCPYDAEKLYINHPKTGAVTGYNRWPLNILALNPTVETITEAVKTGPYGRCVYHCDNNVVDHQVINAEMTDGSTMSFTMTAFTSDGSRYAKIMGTMGDIVADMHTNLIHVNVFGKEPEIIDITKIASDFSGHGGGDNRMVEEFVEMVLNGTEPGPSVTSLDCSVESHYLALAAEKSRLAEGVPVSIAEMRV